jgi:putative membrane protein
MVTSALFAFLHFAAVFGIVGTLFFEWQTMSRAPTCAEARRLQICDRWYGIFAMIVLVVGFARVYHFEKGHAFYTGNPFFQAKLGLFIVIGLLSIYPTVRFIKWRPQTSQGMAPNVSEREYRMIILVLRAEMILLLGMAMCASLMARGIGY